MINFLKNKYTIIFEIIILILSIIWFWESKDIEPIIVFMTVLPLLIVSIGNLKKKKVNIQLVKPVLKTLNKDFLYEYIPGEVGISKIIEDFGQPQKKTLESVESEYMENGKINFNIYEYNFTNAIVLFCTDIELENLIAITLLPLVNKDEPISCRYVFSEDEEYFGDAEFKNSILEYNVGFESNIYLTWSYSAITARYIDYRPIKYLYFTYINYNFHEEADDLYLEKIESISISTDSSIHPIIHFDKLLYN